MSGGTPYIGSTISLISKAEIRYEGILWSIDTKDSTVTLANVRSFGTEDRSVEKQVAPRSEVYEYIVFRGSDIKDLHVSKAPKPPSAVNQDPSILQQGAVGTSYPQFPTPAHYTSAYGNFAHPYGFANPPAAYSPVPQPGINTGRTASPASIPLVSSRTPSPPVNVGPIGSFSQTRTHESETQTPSQKATQTSRNRKPSSRKNSLELNQNGPSKPADKNQENQNTPKKGSDGEQMDGSKKVTPGNQRPRGNQQSNNRKAKPVKFNGEFDFQSSNAKFDKEKIEQELKSEIERMKISVQDEEVIVENDVDVESPGADGIYYDKSKSFFDFISNDPLPGEQGKKTGSWQQERKLNVETFGESGSSYGRGYRGWRGRGRGRGRGRARGWYRNSTSDRWSNQQNRNNTRGNRGGNRGNRGGWGNGASTSDQNRSTNGNRSRNDGNDIST